MFIENILFYGGMAVALFAAIGGMISAVLLRSHKKNLEKQFDQEYGKERLIV